MLIERTNRDRRKLKSNARRKLRAQFRDENPEWSVSKVRREAQRMVANVQTKTLRYVSTNIVPAN